MHFQSHREPHNNQSLQLLARAAQKAESITRTAMVD